MKLVKMKWSYTEKDNNIIHSSKEETVMSNETESMISQAFLMWGMSENEGKEICGGEYQKQAFIPQVLLKKFEAFEINIVMPEGFLMIIDMCTMGNPGISQLLVKEVIENIPDLKPGHKITLEDFARVHSMSFPMLSDPKNMKKYEELWDAQKSPHGNRVDTQEYWLEVFNNSEPAEPWDGIV